MKKLIVGCCYIIIAVILYIGIHIGAILYIPYQTGYFFPILGDFFNALLNTGFLPIIFIIYILKKGFSLIQKQMDKE